MTTPAARPPISRSIFPLLLVLLLSAPFLTAQSSEVRWATVVTLPAQEQFEADRTKILFYRSKLENGYRTTTTTDHPIRPLLIRAVLEGDIIVYADSNYRQPITPGNLRKITHDTVVRNWTEDSVNYAVYIPRDGSQILRNAILHAVVEVNYHGEGKISQNIQQIYLANFNRSRTRLYIPFTQKHPDTVLTDPTLNHLEHRQYHFKLSPINYGQQLAALLHDDFASNAVHDLYETLSWMPVENFPHPLQARVDTVETFSADFVHTYHEVHVPAFQDRFSHVRLYQLWGLSSEGARLMIAPFGYAPCSATRGDDGKLLYLNPEVNWSPTMKH